MVSDEAAIALLCAQPWNTDPFGESRIVFQEDGTGIVRHYTYTYSYTIAILPVHK
jgi:hypothetical protein